MKSVPNASKQMRRLREARGGGIIVFGILFGLAWVGWDGRGGEGEGKRREGLLGHVLVLVRWG